MHTNDLHAHFLPFGLESDYTPEVGDDRTVGGLARIATLLSQASADAGNDKEFLLYDAGDYSLGTLFSMLKKELGSSFRTKIGAAFAMPAFKRFKKNLDYTEYGGALLLGVGGGVMKAHGSSNAKAIKSTLRQAAGFIEADVVNVIKTEISKISLDD
jgi:hypothetical protein